MKYLTVISLVFLFCLCSDIFAESGKLHFEKALNKSTTLRVWHADNLNFKKLIEMYSKNKPNEEELYSQWTVSLKFSDSTEEMVLWSKAIPDPKPDIIDETAHPYPASIMTAEFVDNDVIVVMLSRIGDLIVYKRSILRYPNDNNIEKCTFISVTDWCSNVRGKVSSKEASVILSKDTEGLWVCNVEYYNPTGAIIKTRFVQKKDLWEFVKDGANKNNK